MEQKFLRLGGGRGPRGPSKYAHAQRYVTTRKQSKANAVTWQ